MEQLELLGYKTIWGMLYSSDFGMVQKRRRVYAFSIYDPNNEIVSWKGTRDDLEIILKKIYTCKIYQPKNKKPIKKLIDFSNKDFEESLWAQIKNTPSRIRMIDSSPCIDINLKHIPTVTTKQDRLPNCGSVAFNNKRFDNNGVDYTNWRFITPREAYLLMGFSEKQYQSAKKEMLLVTKKYRAKTDNQAREKLYKQAGNSIAVNIIEMIFYYMSTLEE